jgi:hypothetical protein
MTLQRTIEWHQERLGKPTASRFADIKYARDGKSWSDKTMTYMRELLAERLTGQWNEAYGHAIDWGVEHEDEARELYQSQMKTKVDTVGFIQRDGSGGSPDGVIPVGAGFKAVIEIKCPYNSSAHLDYILNGIDDHMAQIQGNIYFTDAIWCDFISYDLRMPEGLQLFIKRVNRDEDYIADMMARVFKFTADLDEMEKKVREQFKTI